jgi:hypothetical protein
MHSLPDLMEGPISHAIISYGRTHFMNAQFRSLMTKYRVSYRISTPHHPQTIYLAELSNWEIMKILQVTVRPDRKDWSSWLPKALWAYRMTHKTQLGMSPFRLVYRKACHLLVELEHKAHWAIQKCNLDLSKERTHKKLQMSEVDELLLRPDSWIPMRHENRIDSTDPRLGRSTRK